MRKMRSPTCVTLGFVEEGETMGTPAAWQVLTQAVVKLQPVRVEVVDPLPVAAGPGARFYRVADVGDVD